jgi:hypothetical protein
MDDSANIPQEQQAVPDFKPAVTEGVIVRRGVATKVLRGEGGKFKRSAKHMPSSREFTRVTRNYMLGMEAEKNGRITKGSQTKYQMMVENMICIARGVDTVLPNGDTVARDAKADMAAAQAFKIVTERGLGQAPKSDEEQEALKTDGVRFVVMQFPAAMMNQLVVEDKPKDALKPAFIEGEFTEKE